MEFHNDDSRFKCIVGGRRSGKTKAVIQQAIRHSLNDPDRLVFLVGPTFKLAREVLFEEFLTYYDDLLPLIKNCHMSQMRVRFHNGSTMYFKGSDNPDSLRGRSITLYIADEAAFHKPDTWNLVVRPSLSDRKGEAIMISTPNGRNWFYDIYNQDRWSSYHWTTASNTLIDAEEIEMAKEEMSDVDFRQEYMAEFITRAGRVYSDFDDSNITDVDHVYDLKKYDYYLGCDFGYASITAVCLVAVNRYNNTVTIIDELYVSRLQMEDVITAIQVMISKHGIRQKDIIQLYSDPAGNAEELTSGLSPVDELRRGGFTVTNKATRINPGLALMRAFIKNAKGERKFFVHRSCKETIRSLEGYQYDVNRITHVVKEEPLKDGIHDHMADAIRYFFVNKYDYAKYLGKVPEQSSYGTTTLKNKIWKRCSECHRPFLSTTPLTEPPYVCLQHREI